MNSMEMASNLIRDPKLKFIKQSTGSIIYFDRHNGNLGYYDQSGRRICDFVLSNKDDSEYSLYVKTSRKKNLG